MSCSEIRYGGTVIWSFRCDQETCKAEIDAGGLGSRPDIGRREALTEIRRSGWAARRSRDGSYFCPEHVSAVRTIILVRLSVLLQWPEAQNFRSGKLRDMKTRAERADRRVSSRRGRGVLLVLLAAEVPVSAYKNLQGRKNPGRDYSPGTRVPGVSALDRERVRG